MDQRLNKSEILRGKNNFNLVFSSGRSFSGKHLRCHAVPSGINVRSGMPRVLFAVAVGKTLKRAADRNRIKRLVREAYRRNKHMLLPCVPAGADIAALVFVYSPRKAPAVLPTYREIEFDIIRLLEAAPQVLWDSLT